MNRSLFLLPIALLLTSCSTDIGTTSYTSKSVGAAQETYQGVIIASRQVAVKNNNGTLAGGAVGGGLGTALGAVIGGKDNRLTGAAVGGVLGGALGAGGGHLATKKGKAAMEYQVRIQNGRILTVVQGADQVFQVGQDVMVIMPVGNARARIVALD